MQESRWHAGDVCEYIGGDNRLQSFDVSSCHAQRAPNPKFAQPRLSRVNGSRPQRGGTNLGVFVPVWPVMRMPG